MIRKLIGAALLLLGTSSIVGPAAPASAGEGPIDYADCFITADPSTFFAGDVVTITGTGFEPNFETVIEFDGVMVGVATVTADATGSFTIEVIAPEDADAGPHTFSATCDTRGNETTTTVTVSSLTATTTTTVPGGGPLPQTGTDVEPLVVAGGVAVLTGIAFVMVAKRRHRSAA